MAAFGDVSRGQQVAIWAAASMLVATGYAAAVALVLSTSMPSPMEAEADAAFIVELAPIALSAPPPPFKLPPGPPAIAQPEVQAATNAATAAARPIPDLPPLPTHPEVPPDLIPATPGPPRPEAPDPTPSISEPAPAPAAPVAPSLASAPPPIEGVPQGATTTGPVRGLSERERRAVQRWQTALAAHLNLFKQAPKGAPARSGVVQVEVRFAIDPAGHVTDVDLHRSSGEPAYDAAALAIVRRASPVPAPPVDALSMERSFVIPIRFEARR